MINILIRTHRPELLTRCLTSVGQQTYTDTMVLLSENKGNMPGYSYNSLCNELKSRVTQGWFFFLDDDDYLFHNNVLAEIAEHLSDPETAVICQFLRNGWKKPNDHMILYEELVEGQIGMPCLFLHHTKKDLADIQPVENGDFLWINEIKSKMKVKFVRQIVVNSPRRSYGK